MNPFVRWSDSELGDRELSDSNLTKTTSQCAPPVKTRSGFHAHGAEEVHNWIGCRGFDFQNQNFFREKLSIPCRMKWSCLMSLATYGSLVKYSTGGKNADWNSEYASPFPPCHPSKDIRPPRSTLLLEYDRQSSRTPSSAGSLALLHLLRCFIINVECSQNLPS